MGSVFRFNAGTAISIDKNTQVAVKAEYCDQTKRIDPIVSVSQKIDKENSVVMKYNGTFKREPKNIPPVHELMIGWIQRPDLSSFLGQQLISKNLSLSLREKSFGIMCQFKSRFRLFGITQKTSVGLRKMYMT